MVEARVERLLVWPLTGGQGIAVPDSEVFPGGLEHDREFTIYDPDNMTRIRTKPGRSSSSSEAGCTKVKRILPFIGDQVGLHLLDSNGKTIEHTVELPGYSGGEEVTVDEFGDLIPGTDMGDKVAAELSDFLGRSVRLYNKSQAWLRGDSSTLRPGLRKTSPLHIVHRSTLDMLKHGAHLDTEVERRIRPNVVLELGDVDPSDELNWKSLQIGKATVSISRPTLRCSVPGLDPNTGFNHKDIPKLYRSLPQRPDDEGKSTAVIGMYGWSDVADFWKIGQKVIIAH